MNSGSEMVEAQHITGKNIGILVYLHRQLQGKKNFWLPTLSFWATSQTAPASQPIGLDFMVHVSPALKRTMYKFKNFSSPAFNCQSRPKYIFSRDMFCLYHFWAWIHGVSRLQNMLGSNISMQNLFKYTFCFRHNGYHNAVWSGFRLLLHKEHYDKTKRSLLSLHQQ